MLRIPITELFSAVFVACFYLNCNMLVRLETETDITKMEIAKAWKKRKQINNHACSNSNPTYSVTDAG
jgi:hypothetical protein